MADPFHRDCKFCGARIRMAKSQDGSWHAYELEYNGGKHTCQTRVVAATEEIANPEVNFAIPRCKSEMAEAGIAKQLSSGTGWGCFVIITFILGVLMILTALSQRLVSFFLEYVR